MGTVPRFHLQILPFAAACANRPVASRSAQDLAASDSRLADAAWVQSVRGPPPPRTGFAPSCPAFWSLALGGGRRWGSARSRENKQQDPILPRRPFAASDRLDQKSANGKRPQNRCRLASFSRTAPSFEPTPYAAAATRLAKMPKTYSIGLRLPYRASGDGAAADVSAVVPKNGYICMFSPSKLARPM